MLNIFTNFSMAYNKSLYRLTKESTETSVHAYLHKAMAELTNSVNVKHRIDYSESDIFRGQLLEVWDKYEETPEKCNVCALMLGLALKEGWVIIPEHLQRDKEGTITHYYYSIIPTEGKEIESKIHELTVMFSEQKPFTGIMHEKVDELIGIKRY